MATKTLEGRIWGYMGNSPIPSDLGIIGAQQAHFLGQANGFRGLVSEDRNLFDCSNQ